MVRAAQRTRVALARTSLDGHGHGGLSAYLLRRPLRAGVVTQPAAQTVVQGETARTVLCLDVRRRRQPLRRVRQRDHTSGERLQHEQ